MQSQDWAKGRRSGESSPTLRGGRGRASGRPWRERFKYFWCKAPKILDPLSEYPGGQLGVCRTPPLSPQKLKEKISALVTPTVMWTLLEQVGSAKQWRLKGGSKKRCSPGSAAVRPSCQACPGFPFFFRSFLQVLIIVSNVMCHVHQRWAKIGESGGRNGGKKCQNKKNAGQGRFYPLFPWA